MMVAPDPAAIAEGSDRRILNAADVGRSPAARVEAAALRERRDRRHDAGDFLEPAATLTGPGPEERERGDKAARVGMTRRAEHVLGLALLDDAAGIHDTHPPAHIGDQAEIVADHQHSGPFCRAQVANEIEDLGLHGHVERRRRLVGEKQVRITGQCDGDHDPLAHAAGELMRVILHAALGRRHTDACQRLDGAALRVPPGGAFVEHEHLGDLPANRRNRVQCRHGLLEDHGDPSAAQVAHRRGRESLNLLAVEADPPPAKVQRRAEKSD
jgi:hypothetical protein